MSALPTATGPGRVGRAWAVLDTVLDPEVPALSVRDLGIVRDVVESTASPELEIVLTPTSTSVLCPPSSVPSPTPRLRAHRSQAAISTIARAMRLPSSAVITDADSPGVLSRIAVVEPPYMPP